ncbi:MAG: hypothetical protein ACFE9L_15295 [Candidatus Hodarchaeota archaeon]
MKLLLVDNPQPELGTEVTRLSEVVEADIGIGVAYGSICEDLLNILSFLLIDYFALADVPAIIHKDKIELSPESKVCIKDLSDIPASYYPISKKIIDKEGYTINEFKHMNTIEQILSLRESQFHFFLKVLALFNQSLKTSDLDIFIAIILLVSCIESIATKYGETDEEFSDEKKEYMENSRVLFGYNATIIKKSDLNFTCWVILEDQGDYDVVWNSVSINCTVHNDWKYTENTTSIRLNMTTKTEKSLTIKTPYEDLTKENVKIDIVFAFYEEWGDQEISKFTLTHEEKASFIGFMGIILVLIALSILRQKKRIKSQKI